MVSKDKKTSITFHNGILTIGGTIIEIAYEDSHIFFDFGSEYNPADPIQPNDLQGLLDHGLIPYLDNMFDTSIPLDGYTSSKTDFKNTAVFLSHVHLDHSKAINYLNPEVPLYTLEGTKSLLNTLNINDDFLFPKYGEHKTNTREIIGVKEYETVEIGKIKVTVMPVDHDAYGACGLLIETPEMRIAYTGDIRLHGYREAASLKFTELCKHADVLLMEGVSVSFQEVDEVVETNETETEGKLIENINEVIKTNPNRQLTFNYYISNIERILKILETCERCVVLEDYYAYTVKEATGKNVHYFSLDGKDYGLDPKLQVDFNELLEDENRFFWQLSGTALKYIDKLKEGGIYVHSNAQPLGDFDPYYAPFMKAFEDRHIEVVIASCSGHAKPKDLIKIIDLIEPKLLAPIHSLHPERLVNKAGDILLPEKNKQYKGEQNEN